jgi:hypothetical protein
MGRGAKKAFKETKRAHTNVSALGLPDVVKLPTSYMYMKDWEQL